LKEEVLNFQIPPLDRSPSAHLCNSVSWEQNGYYAAQKFFVRDFVSSGPRDLLISPPETFSCGGS